jgi:hypothetical protein
VISTEVFGKPEFRAGTVPIRLDLPMENNGGIQNKNFHQPLTNKFLPPII